MARACAAMLIILAVVSFFTGARTSRPPSVLSAMPWSRPTRRRDDELRDRLAARPAHLGRGSVDDPNALRAVEAWLEVDVKTARARQWLAVGAVLAAYGLLAVLRVVTWELSHTYGHWIEGIDRADLPALTVLVLPVLDLGSSDPSSSVVVLVLSLLFLAWPGLQLAVCLRRPGNGSQSALALGLFAWLCLLLAACTLVAAGLWLPFSLL